MPILANGFFELSGPYGESGVVATYTEGQSKLVGVFNLNAVKREIPIDVPNGRHFDLLSGSSAAVANGYMDLPAEPFIFFV